MFLRQYFHFIHNQQKVLMSDQIQRRPRLTPLVAALSLACSTGALAQAPEQELGTIQITTTRGADTNTVVGAARIEVEQAVSLQDLFKQMPEVSVGGGGLPVAQKLYVRGIGERMLAVTIDGAAQPDRARWPVPCASRPRARATCCGRANAWARASRAAMPAPATARNSG
jgi:hypothetical protein